MARDGKNLNTDKYGIFPQSVAERIYQSVIMGSPPPPSELTEEDVMGQYLTEPYLLRETLPPYDWWRAKNPDNNGEYFDQSDFSDLAKAHLYAPVYAKATKLALWAEQDKFPAYLKETDTADDDIADEEWVYIKNRDPNFFAMKGDIVWCVETETSDIVPVSGGRKSIDGIIFNSADKSDDILTAPTDVEYSEVILLGRPAPNEAAVLSAWSECVPNLYESLDIEKYYSCRIARAGGIWVYESIGCEELRDQQQALDTEIFGEFDGRARYNELHPTYFKEELHEQGK